MACVAALDGRPNAEPLRVWGGNLPDDPAHAEELEQERRKASEEMILAGIRRSGAWFPGD